MEVTYEYDHESITVRSIRLRSYNFLHGGSYNDKNKNDNITHMIKKRRKLNISFNLRGIAWMVAHYMEKTTT